jgi:protein MpaA
VRREVVLGRSAEARPIVAWEVGNPNSRHVILVVGCIHGNEPAGIAIANALAHGPAPARLLFWIVPDLNPDGVAAGTRQNGNGVDLNRNFPWQWRPLGPRGSPFYAGRNATSEPETRIAARLIRRVRPRLSIWFHQHLDVVDQSRGDIRVERRFARLVGMRMQHLTRYPGSAVNWEHQTLPGSTAFVVELPEGPLPEQRVDIFVRAVESLSATTP